MQIIVKFLSINGEEKLIWVEVQADVVEELEANVVGVRDLAEEENLVIRVNNEALEKQIQALRTESDEISRDQEEALKELWADNRRYWIDLNSTEEYTPQTTDEEKIGRLKSLDGEARKLEAQMSGLYEREAELKSQKEVQKKEIIARGRFDLRIAVSSSNGHRRFMGVLRTDCLIGL